MLGTPQAITLYETVEAQLKALIAHYKTVAVDGLTVEEIWELVQDAIASAMRIIKSADAQSGNTPSLTFDEVIMHFAEEFYDQVLGPIDLPKIPNVIETRFVDPALRGAFLRLVRGMVNSLKKILGRAGWEADAPATPTGPSFGAPPDLPPGFVPY